MGRASSLLGEYLEARSQLVLPVPDVINGPSQQWQPPIGLIYKMNFDAAVFNELSATSVGVVIRNGDGCIGVKGSYCFG